MQPHGQKSIGTMQRFFPDESLGPARRRHAPSCSCGEWRTSGKGRTQPSGRENAGKLDSNKRRFINRVGQIRAGKGVARGLARLSRLIAGVRTGRLPHKNTYVIQEIHGGYVLFGWGVQFYSVFLTAWHLCSGSFFLAPTRPSALFKQF